MHSPPGKPRCGSHSRAGAGAPCWHRAGTGVLRVQKALYPEGEGVCHVVLLHPPAGIAGGDVLDIGIELVPRRMRC